MATTTIHQVREWNNFHSNGPFPLETLMDIDTDQTIPNLLDRYNDTGVELQRLLKDCVDNGKCFRAYGSAWSMSNIAHSQHRMLFNARLNIKMAISQDQLHSNSTYEAENLFFIQCGAIIKEISEYLLPKNKSLKTCGASNGQTIAGAISTGVHGSAIDVGSIQDYVVGLNLIIGPGADDIVYLERETRPALSNAFATSIRARVIRNDKMFNAALVGLGSFGMIHGVVIEAEPLFLLKRYIKKLSKADAMQLAESMNFTTAKFKIPDELEVDGAGKRPFHFKFFINAYNSEEPFVTEYIFKIPYRKDYPNPLSLIKKSLYKDLPCLVSKFAARFKCTIPMLVKEMGKGVFDRVDKMTEGTLAEIFWDTDLKMASLAGSFGVDATNSGKALDILIRMMKEKGPIPGILAMRFVKGSEATLAFTRFPITCVIEVDCVSWKPSKHIISFNQFMELVFVEFKRADIPFTLHWGKNAPYHYPNLVNYMYGNAAVEEWKNMRAKLLSEEMADLFSNDFLKAVGLSSPVPAPLVPA